MPQEFNMQEAIKLAIQTEKNVMDFYQRAASITKVPLGTLADFPSMVRVTNSVWVFSAVAIVSPSLESIGQHRQFPAGGHGGLRFPDQFLVFRTPMFDRTQNGTDFGLAKGTDGPPGDIAAEVFQYLNVPGLPFLSMNSLERLNQPGTALTAGRTFPA